MKHKPPRHNKKLQSEQASEEIRTDDLIKATQIEAKRSGNGDDGNLKDIPVTNSNYWRFKGEQRSSLPKGIKWGIAGLVVLFIGGSVASFYLVRRSVASTLSSRVATLQAGVADLQNLDPKSASQEFSSLNSASPSGFFNSIISLFQGGSGAIHSFTDLSSQLAILSQAMTKTEGDIFGFVTPVASSTTPTSAQATSTLVTDLQNIRTALTAINADSDQLSSAAAYFGSAAPVSGQEYLSLKTQVQGAEQFLNAFVPWLSDASSTHHILVLFQNPSELRPGGGFLGSYADVSINSGRVSNISIHDVADVDKAFTQKIVPPVPLQLEETSWRPADGNWFFDFPTSASETLQLFNESALYATSSTNNGSGTFEGVIAVTPQVLTDLLSITGPVTVSSTSFTSSNLVVQIQKIVQAGQAQNAKVSIEGATYPKGILSALWSSVLQKLASSTDDQKTQILNLAFNWISNKDVMAYFTDSNFETFATTYGAAGNVYQLPQNINGDYLAVVNADINGDKSELYIAQNVNYDATINADGTLSDHLVIDRKHNGNESPYWWYKTTNQDYLQLFVPEGATLTNESGGILKSVPAPINYAQAGYTTDPLLLAIQSSTQSNFSFPKVITQQQAGKEVFGVWSRVYAGASTELSFDYTQHLSVMPADGVQYQFVFEKQSGAQSDNTFEIDAPLGYVFAENGLASFMYSSASSSGEMPGSMVVNLTLQKLH
jgi:hypothetical protein